MKAVAIEKRPSRTATRALPAIAQADLVMLTGPQAGRVYSVVSRLVIGRASESDVCVEGDNVSRSHCAIEQIQPGQFEVSDLGSRNGVLVNGHPVTRQTLCYGDRISVADEALFVFTRHDSLTDQLVHHQRLAAVGQLAGGVAHDFNNLLNVVLMNVELLIDDSIPEAERRTVLGDVRIAGRRAAGIASQLLGYARRGKSEDRAIDISQLTREVVRIARPGIPQSIGIELDLQPGLLGMGDATQLHQVIMNLVFNARDAMADGGAIRVGGALDDQQIVLTVEDEGHGMSAAVAARIFEPFFTTKSRGRGHGLGLATARGIIENHGGTLDVQSTPGKGSTFTVRVPALPSKRSAVLPTSGSLDALDYSTGRVVVVDGEPLNLRGAARYLRRFGYEVLVASDCEQLALQLREAPAKAVVFDVDVGVDDVIDVVRSAQPEGVATAPKLIAMSALADMELGRRCKESGVDTLLRKPLERDPLELALRAK